MTRHDDTTDTAGTDAAAELATELEASGEDPPYTSVGSEAAQEADPEPLDRSTADVETVPVDSPEALSQYWNEYWKPLKDTQAEAVIAALVKLIDDGRYAIDQPTLAARVGDELGKPDYQANDLTAIEALPRLAAAGAVSKDNTIHPNGQVKKRYVLYGPVVRWLHRSLHGYPEEPSGRAETVVKYLGATAAAGLDPDPRAAWLFVTVDKFATVADPVVELRQFGVPERGDWTTAFPFGKYLLYDAIGGGIAEYAVDVVVRSASGSLTIDDPERLVYALRADLFRIHAAALYPRHDPFTMAAAGTELVAADPSPDPTEPVVSNRVPSFYRAVVHEEDAAVRAASLQQVWK